MNKEVHFLMSQKQLNRFAVISKVIDGHLTNAEASASLGISERQVIRLKKGIIADGAAFLIHKILIANLLMLLKATLLIQSLRLRNPMFTKMLISCTFRNCLNAKKISKSVIPPFILSWFRLISIAPKNVADSSLTAGVNVSSKRGS